MTDDLAARLTPRRRMVVTIGITISAMVTLLDTAIVSVALAHMQGGLSVDQDQISWVITAYLVTLAVMTPPTGWLSARFGRKRLFLVSITCFAAASLLCGFSDSLVEIITLRIVQAAFGAFLMPLTQAAVLDIHPPENHGKAIALWSFGMAFGSFFGPVLGGHIIEVWSWRGAFFIAAPFCIVSFILIFLFLPRDERQTPPPFTASGYLFLAIGVAALQLMLDRGEREDWLASDTILFAAVVAGTGLAFFAFHLAVSDRPFFNPSLLRDRNFASAMLIMFVNGVLQFTMVTILPLFLQNMLSYGPILTGYILTPRAIGAMVGNALAGQIINRIDPRLLAFAGFLIIANSFYWMMGITADVDPWFLTFLIVLQGLGISIVWVPLNVIAFATLPSEQRAEGASLMHLLRNIGGSVGVAMLVTLLTRNTRENRATLLEQVTPYNELFQWQSMPELWSPDELASLAMLEQEVTRQAAMIAYINDFKLIFIIVLCIAPLVLLMRRPPAVKSNRES
jgi:DHA2 family multidrug resistance protein